MALSTNNIRVLNEGAITRVFVVPGFSRERLVRFVSVVLVGAVAVGYGTYELVRGYRVTLELNFDYFMVALLGFALLGWAVFLRPIKNGWTHQFVFDGEAVHCIDPGGQSMGTRERVSDLKLDVEAPSGFVILGVGGRLGQRLSLEDGLSVLVELQRAQDTVAPGHQVQSRIVGLQPGPLARSPEASMLPRSGIIGVNPSGRVFWPLVLLLLATPTGFLIAGLVGYADNDPSTSLRVLGTSLNRRRVAYSGSTLPERVRFTPTSVRVEQKASHAGVRQIIEVPFTQLHAVEVLDPSHDEVSHIAGVEGVAGSGLILIHGASSDIIEGRSGTRTVVLRGIGRTDALELRNVILSHRDRWLVREAQATHRARA